MSIFGFDRAVVEHAEKLPIVTKTIAPSVPVISIDALNNYGDSMPSSWGGEKFLGGFGVTKDYSIVDYYALRTRSKQLFTENLYARGLIRRLITNEINKGLALEATPDSEILGVPREELAVWSENTERRFSIWGKSPIMCDYKGMSTFGAIQRQARMMAIVSGDVLVILRQSEQGLPTVDLIDAEHVSDPDKDADYRAIKSRGNTVEHGVELDARSNHVAYFVLQDDDTYKRVPARGPKTGRLQAWLLYGTEKLLDDVRGQSLLALVIQSLKEVDRYRDAEQRAAVVNSMIAVWVEKTQDKMGTNPLSNAAVRKDVVTTQNDSQGRKDIEFSSQMPGMMLQELQHGEKPTSYDTKRPNVNFGTFEASIINAIAWANEIPPEVLTLAFANNYSASRGAVNEFKLYLDRIRSGFGEEFCSPIYQDYLLSDVLQGGIKADGLLEAWRTPSQWDRLGAWNLADWAGAIKPSVDMLKEAKAYQLLVAEGWITRDRAARELTGMKFSKVTQQLGLENKQLVEALDPLIEAGLIKDENLELESEEDTNDN